MNKNGISDDESLGVSMGDGRGGFRSKETIQCSYLICGVYCSGDISGDYGKGEYKYQ